MMWEQLKRYWEIAKLALLQEKAAKDSKIKGMNEHEKEFLPAVLEVTEMPPSHAARLLTYVIMLMFTVLILWSILGKIDIIATSAGKLMPASNIKTIQTLTDSEIEEIYVQEGQYVKEGQDLIKFNQTEVLANISRVENEIEALEIAVARLKALLTDNPEANFSYNPEIDEYLIKMHKDLLKSQMTEKKAQIEVLDGQIVKAEKEKDTIQAELNRIEKLLPSVEERIEKKRILVDKKLLARLTFLEQEEELTNLQEQRNVQVKKMAETEANIESLKKQKRQYLAEDAAGVDATAAAAKLRAARKDLNDFVRATGGRDNSARTSVSGFGRSQASRATALAQKQERLDTVNAELSKLRQDGIIKSKGGFVLPPAAPDALIFERNHVFQRIAEREMSFTDAEKIISSARFALRQQNGKVHAYYSADGFVAVRNDGMIYSMGRLDEGGKKLMEVAKKHGF